MKKAQFFYLLRRGFFAGGGGEWSTLVNAFKTRVIADGGTLESESCIRDDVKYLIQNPEPVAFTGLLNDYSGAAAAYSLRLLDNTYTGDAIVVRRASDNTTQSIGFVNNELDTTSLESFCSGTDGFVATWYDQSGSGNDAAQVDAASQPKIVSGGTSLGYIENLTSASNQILQSSFSYTSGSAFSAFMVVQNFGKAVFGGTEVGPYYAVAESGSANSFSNFSSISYYNNGSSIGTTRGDIYTATSSFAELTTLATPDSTSGMRLGYSSAEYNFIRMKEYIIYDNQTISRTGVENNIITHYGF